MLSATIIALLPTKICGKKSLLIRVLSSNTPGTYDAPKAGKVMVARKQDHLTLSAGGHIYLLFPESDSVFFTKDRDLTFEFVKEGERVSKVVIREHGAVMEEAPAVR